MMQFLSTVRRMASTKILPGASVIFLPLVFQSNAVAITVKSQPSSHTVTSGKSITLRLNAQSSPGGGGKLTYSWFKNGQKLKASGNSLTIPSATEKSEGVYGCSVRDAVSVYHCNKFRIYVVAENIYITKQPRNHSSSVGGSVWFSVDLSNENDLQYRWYHNGKAIKDGDSQKLHLQKVTWADAGQYRVVVRAAGSTKQIVSRTVSLQVHPFKPARITQQPESTEVRAGQSAKFIANATGSGQLHYQWFFNGKPIQGSTDKTLWLSKVNADDVGNYKVVVRNKRSSDESDVAALKMDSPQKIVSITRQPSNQLVNEGTDVTLAVVAESANQVRYQWFFNGNAINGATDRTLVINNASWDDKGKYYVTVKSGNVSATSENAQVSILTSSSAAHSVQLSWNRPTKRENGKTLYSSEIANYNLYYSNRSSGTMSRIATITPSKYKYVVNNLDDGAHYFAISAVDDGGLESPLSKKLHVSF